MSCSAGNWYIGKVLSVNLIEVELAFDGWPPKYQALHYAYAYALPVLLLMHFVFVQIQRKDSQSLGTSCSVVIALEIGNAQAS